MPVPILSANQPPLFDYYADPGLLERCHPLLPSRAVSINDLQHLYLTSIGGWGNYGNAMRLTEMGMHDPDYLTPANEALQLAIDDPSEAAVRRARGRVVRACWPLIVQQAHGLEPDETALDTASRNLALIIAEGHASSGDLAEELFMGLGVYMAKTHGTPAPQISTPRQEASPLRNSRGGVFNHDYFLHLRGYGKIPVQAKADLSAQGGDATKYDPLILCLGLSGIVADALNRLDGGRRKPDANAPRQTPGQRQMEQQTTHRRLEIVRAFFINLAMGHTTSSPVITEVCSVIGDKLDEHVRAHPLPTPFRV